MESQEVGNEKDGNGISSSNCRYHDNSSMYAQIQVCIMVEDRMYFRQICREF